MSTTCVLFIIIAVLLTYIYVKCKRNSLKLSDNREEITRFSRPLVNRTENEDTSVVAVTIMRHSAPNEVLAENAPKITSSNEDYERISEKSESSFDAGNAEQGTSTSDVQHSQNHHNYQELNIDALLSNMQGYQALNRTIGDSARGVELPLYIRKYEALNFVHNPQSSEYQKLHLYANIDGKK
ncbi:uncharacterized protein LOC116296341 [Actinia tenebrosa]|uniref:Uncharacterized protein LOC116296341 n=1 Tax=Actinia tenebrosa TaxID=6105 RepID=A0A6P8HXY4_ACTTE|nr:uncharacterized protein LOC116296341 [Actinia tenebrosa]